MRSLWLPTIIALLASLSLLILHSVTPTLVGRQVLVFGLGAVVFIIGSQKPLQFWLRFPWAWYGLTIGLLLITRLIGEVTRGTVSWIPVGPFHLQTSQFAPTTIGLWLVSELTIRPPKTWHTYLRLLLFAALPAGMILLEPDFGSTIILLAAITGAVFVARIPAQFFLWTILAGAVALIFGWQFVLRPYQKERLLSFVAMQENRSDASYNAVQSVIAVGSGKILGRGIGQGIQSHLRFLPERQTDFIFASFAEEMGLIGTLPLITLYALLTGTALWCGIRTTAESERLFCFLTAAFFSVQSGINIGMNMGALPITGITLPFLSYGGSSILAMSWHFGLLHSIMKRLPATLHLHLR